MKDWIWIWGSGKLLKSNKADTFRACNTGNGCTHMVFLTKLTDRRSSNLSLTHWGRVTHICVGNLTIIGSDNGLSPDRRQAITWTNVGILLIGPLGTNFSKMLIEIPTFSLKKIRLKMSSAKCCSFRFGLNELNDMHWFNMTESYNIILYYIALGSLAGIILCVHSDNQSPCFTVMQALIGCGHTQSNPCLGVIGILLTEMSR